jgi:hypothetical protein
MLYYSKWLSSFRFSDCNIPSTNSLSPLCPIHLLILPNWKRTQLKKHCYVIFCFPSSLVAFSHASYPTLTELTEYKNFQPDETFAFNLPCANQSCIIKDRVFCDVVTFCLTEPNFSEDPTTISVDYLKDKIRIIKSVSFMIRVERPWCLPKLCLDFSIFCRFYNSSPFPYFTVQ